MPQQTETRKHRMTWFRFYTDALDDPKVQRLPGQLYKTWVNILCLAGQNDGKIPSIDDLAFRLRISVHEAQQQFDELVLAGLIDILPDRTREPHNWNARQFKDSSYDRVKKYREKRKEAGLPTLGDYNCFRPAIIARDGKCCAYCGKSGKTVVDHMVPIAMGGNDEIDNLCLACKECNSGKSGRTPELAGMKFASDTALKAHDKYKRDRDESRTVTVSETHTEQIQSRADTEPESEPQQTACEPRPAPAAVRLDLRELSDRLFEAAGPALASQAIAPGLAAMTVPAMWIDQGCDLELDIIETLKAQATKRRGVMSWEYFTRAVAEAKAKRLAGLPKIDLSAAAPQQFHQTFHGSVKAMLAEMGVE